MCITIGPAKLSKTKILALPLKNGNHLLAYSNKARNVSGKPNAMILPIPGTTTKEMFYDTSLYSDFLKDIEKAIKPKSRGVNMTKGVHTLGIETFQLGMYYVLVSQDLFGIKDALNTIPENERPVINDILFDFFAAQYNGWSFVVCCFSGDKEMESQPIMLEYTPTFPDYLYFPGMDAHNGLSPQLNQQVPVDHCLMTNSTIPEHSKYKPDIEFTQTDAVPDFLKIHYNGRFYEGSQQNGDWYLDLTKQQDLHSRLDMKRLDYHPATV